MIYMFDIDGTLTEPRQRMSQEFENFFLKWMELKTVYLVTGSDMDKVREQVPHNILEKCVGIFTCMGNELTHMGKQIYKNEIQFPDTLIGWLQQQVEYSDCPVKRQNNFEYRTGMLNFSTIGRTATKEEREEYFKWDKTSGERNRIATYINNKYPEYEACIGGQISIDIQARGKNKVQALHWIQSKFSEPVYFFGDHCDDGGNDAAIAEELDKPWGNGYYLNVKNPSHLMDFLVEWEEECLDIW